MKPCPKRLLFTIITLSALLLAAPAIAAKSSSNSDKSAGDAGIAMQVGTLGLEFEFTKPITKTLVGRLGVGGLMWGYDVEVSDIKYDFDMKIFSVGAYLDWHPGGSGFRLSIGAIANSHDITTDAGLAPDHMYTIGDHEYPGILLGGIDADVEINPIGPYAGIGYNDVFSKGSNWSFNFEVGIVWWGKPNVTLTARNKIDIPNLNEDLSKEEQEIEDQISILEFYPVIALGVTYRF